MPTSVLVLWWIMLAVALVLILPTAFYLLNRTFKSARDIRLYTAETLEAAHGIALNLVGAAQLDRTPEMAARVQETASALAAEAGELEQILGRV